jgi:subtilisin family serine protease
VWWRTGTPDADVDAPEAWALTRGAGTTVAVVDTGVDAQHPELAGRLVGGYDFVDGDADPQDAHGHGTHVAGTIAAGENGIGVIGVAPDALVMPLRVLDASGSGSSAGVTAAFNHAGDQGVSVVNASLGSQYPSRAERDAIRSHPETLYVVAAGNGGADGVGDDVDGAAPEYPCAYDEPNLVCVGATDSRDARTSFSNYGAASVDLFAPGANVVSTFPRGRATVLGASFPTGDGYEIMQGTSMASPHVAGAAALAGALRPDWSPGQVKAALLEGADRLSALTGASVTGGRLNAAAAVRIAGGVRETPLSTQAPLEPEAAQPVAPLAPVAPDLPLAPAAPATPASAPTLSRVYIAGTPRVCRRRGCHARTATLSFVLAAEADVTVRLERRRCVRTRCGWRSAGIRSRRAPAGRARWRIAPRLLGMRLERGAWRVTLATEANSARRTFRVR